MAVKESQRRASAKYQEKLDDVKIRVPAGMRDEIKAQAKEKGYPSVNAYVIALIERDKKPLKI